MLAPALVALIAAVPLTAASHDRAASRRHLVSRDVAVPSRHDSTLFSAQVPSILEGKDSAVVPKSSFNIIPPSDPSSAPAKLVHSKRDGPINPGFNYGTDKIRGVNLGGWLVLEPWITPSLFPTSDKRIVDEYTLGQYSDRSALTKKLQQHWGSWITKDDLVQIKAAGLNHVRIGIGYWAFDVSGGEPYVQGQLPYLKQGAAWAKEVGLKVVIDLHGAPGSQNGFDNSGRRGAVQWPYNANNVARTRNVISELASEFSKPQYAGTVTSIECLNEPAGYVSDNGQMVNTVKQYYYDSYGIVRHPNKSPSQSNLFLSIHDAFLPLASWSNSFPPPRFEGVALDTHIYSVFVQDELKLSLPQRITAYCNMRNGLQQSNNHIWTYVGEWTTAPTDCAPRLNGQGIGARYDGTYPGSSRIGSCNGQSGDGSSFSQAYRDSLRKLFEVQTSVYESAASGWIMWTWKTEAAADWDYQRGLRGGWIPRNPTEKRFGNQCA